MSGTNARGPIPTLVDPLAEPEWDSRLRDCPGATFFHTQAWARALCATYGYRPTYFTIERTDGSRALLPLLEIDSWLTGRRGVGLPFTDECAPLCRDAAEFRILQKAATAHGRERGWKYLESRGGRSWWGDVPASTSFHHHRLELQPDEKVQFARTDSAVRRAIRKAEQGGLTLRNGADLATVRAFYDLMCLTRKRHGLPAQPFRFFENIQRHVLAPGWGTVFLASLGDRPVAGAVFFRFGGEAIYKFGASDERLQQLRANNLVMWEAIKWHAAQGCRLLDFGRTSLGNEGLRKFKLGWGAVERLVEYVRQDLRSDSFLVVRDTVTGWHNRVFRALPISLSRLIGTVLYPHMA